MKEMLDFSEEQQQSEKPDFQRYLDAFRRHHMLFLATLLVVWLAVWGASWVISPKYTSTTTILLELPSMPKDYVAPNVGEDLQSRLQTITSRILNRTSLLTIIDRLHLYGGGGAAMADAKVELMRKNIDIDVVRGDGGAKNLVTGFSVAFSASKPQLAQQVTTELTDLFIDENIKSRQQQSQETTAFLESQLETASSSLTEQEKRVREYSAQHPGELPSQQNNNIQILSGLQSELRSEQDALSTAKQQGIYYQSMVEQYKASGAPANTSIDAGASTLPGVDQQLDQLREKLADLNAHYTDRHPDVLNLQRQIAKLEKTREKLLSGNQDKTKPMSSPRSAINPALAQAESQLAANRAEVANRGKTIEELKARINLYQSHLNNEPIREQELADLTRGYEQSKANYDDLLKKKNASVMATSVEQLQQGEHFRIIDPPSLPSAPSSPNRIKLCGIGFAAGVLGGLLLVVTLEFMDDRIFSEQELKTVIPVAILAEIPEIVTNSDIMSRKRRTILGWSAAVLVLLIIVAGSTFTFLHG